MFGSVTQKAKMLDVSKTHLIATERHLPHGTQMLPAIQHMWTCPTLTQAKQANTWFAYSGGIAGWADCGIWLSNMYRDGLLVSRQSPIQQPDRKSNPQPLDCKSNTIELPVTPRSQHTSYLYRMKCVRSISFGSSNRLTTDTVSLCWRYVILTLKQLVCLVISVVFWNQSSIPLHTAKSVRTIHYLHYNSVYTNQSLNRSIIQTI